MHHELSEIDVKTCLVTGATSGIGRMAAFQLAERGLRVIVASRDEKKCAGTVEWIANQTENPAVDYAVVDLSDQADIHRFARDIHERYQRLDVLINNAGSFFLRRRENSSGIEMTFALNHLGYFSTTLLLLDLLKASAPARIVNVASGSHRNSTMHFDDLQLKKGYRPFEAYGQSKLANILFTHELARRLDPSLLTVNALHPGVVATNIASENLILGWLAARFMWIIGKSPAEGARTPVYLATSEEVQGVTGKYFIDCEQVPSAPYSYDREAEERLWRVSLELTGIEDPT
jgi:NAD(P)-dependent dehydrogenase (short-subunit alcohol dehydrogenase family)